MGEAGVDIAEGEEAAGMGTNPMVDLAGGESLPRPRFYSRVFASG